MATKDPIKPGQVTSIPQNTYDPNTEAGRVVNNLSNIAPPTAPNLLFNNTAPTTPSGASAVNPAYALYINTLKNANTKQEFLNTPYYTQYNRAERYSNNEVGGYHPYDMNLENWYGDNQSWFKQWGNSIGKFGTKALGSFANSLMDIPNIVSATAQGDLDKMWDNPTNSWATDLMDWSEKVMPNYKTNWEREHPFKNLIPFYGNSGNSWGGVLENAGFTVGAIGGAVIEDLAIGALTGGVGEVPLAATQINKAIYKFGKLVNAGDDALSALKASIKNADDIVKGLKGIDRFNYAVRKGIWGANMITSGISEAAFEGIESYRTLSQDLQQQFLEENGRMPGYEDHQKIEEDARDAANTRFLLNTGLLAVTNSIQWGSLLRPFNATKDLIEAEAKEGVKVGLKEGSRDIFEAVDTSSKLAKWGKKLTGNKAVLLLTESGSEGFEEGAQYAIETGVNDFYKRKYNDANITTANNFLKSFGTGMANALGTQEGWENIIYGILGGAMYKAGEHAYYKLKGIDPHPNYKKQIDAVLAGLNSQSLSGVFENKYSEGVDAIAIQKDLQEAASSGNIFQYKNFKHDAFVNFILSGLAQNKFDARMEQLQELKKLDGEEFEKTFGIPSNTENKKTVAEYVEKLENNANYMKDIHKRVSRTFINPFTYKGTGTYKNKEQKEKQDIENENYRVYEQVKDDLVRSMSIAKDSSDRIGDVFSQIADAQKVVEPLTVAKLSSAEGLSDIKKEYKEKQRLAEESLKLAKDAKNERDAKWYGEKVDEIDDILNEKDEKIQNEKYNKFLKDVFNRTQKENNTYYSIYGTAAQQASVNTPFPNDVIKDVINLGRDAYYLQKRNEVAIDRYARLTTKGGFKDVFEDIKKLRKAAADMIVPLQEDPIQGQEAQQQSAFNTAQEAEGQNPTQQPQNQGNNAVDQQQGFEEVIDPNMTAEEDRRLREILVEVADGKHKNLSDVEFEGLGFQSIDDIKFDNPNVNIKDYIMMKSNTGKNWYIAKDFVSKVRASLNQTPQTSNQTASNVAASSGNNGLRMDDFVRKAFIPSDLKLAFNNAAFSGSPTKFTSEVGITVKPLTPELKEKYDSQKANNSYTPVTDFPGVYVASSPTDLSLTHNGVEIGKIGYPKRLLFKVGDKFVTLDKLSPEQYQQFTRKPSAQYASDLEDYKKQVAFTNLLAAKFKNNNYQQFDLSPAELSNLADIIVKYGELDLVGNNRPTFDKLKYNGVSFKTPDGNTVIALTILSVPKRFNADSMVRERTGFNNPIYGQAFYDAGADDSALRDFINNNADRVLDVGTRYIGVIEKPDGTIAFIALHPSEMSKENKDDLFNSIKERSQISANTNIVETTKEDSTGTLIVGNNQEVHYKLPNDAAKEFNKDFNEDINEKLFISDNSGKVFFDLTVSPIGAVRLDIHEPNPSKSSADKKDTGYRTRIVIYPQKMQNIKSMDELLEAINKEIEKKGKEDPYLKGLNISLKTNNLKQNISVDENVTNAEAIASKLTAATSTDVFKNGTVLLSPKADAVQKEYEKESGKNANVKATPEKTAAGTPVEGSNNNLLKDELDKYEMKYGVLNVRTEDFEITLLSHLDNTYSIATSIPGNTSTGWKHVSALSGHFKTRKEAIDFAYDIVFPYAKEKVRKKYANNPTSDVSTPVSTQSEKESQNASWENNFTTDNPINELFGPQTTLFGIPVSNISSEVSTEGINPEFFDEQETNDQEVAAQMDKGESPVVVKPSMFAATTEVSMNAQGDPIDLKNTNNQEDVKDVVYDSVKDALAAMGVLYSTLDGVLRFTDADTGDIIEVGNLSPAELANKMGLTIKEQEKPKGDSGFDFKLSNGINDLNKLMSLENARAYINSILPSFINVEEVNTIIDKIREQGVENPSENVWGAFRDGVIYLNSKVAEEGTVYHEAFHTVFNMFLSSAEQKKLLDYAKDQLYSQLKKEGKSIRDYIKEQRDKGYWAGFTGDAADKATEEWMAEEFRKWKTKKNNAGPLQKLFDLIKRFFKFITRRRNDLDRLFNKIDSGGFKYSNISSNSFTQETNDENVTPEFKFMLIPARSGKLQVGKGTIDVNRNLDAKTSKQVVQNVAAYFSIYRKTGNYNKLSDSKLLDKILDDLKLTYNSNNAAYAGSSQEQLSAIDNSDENFIYSNEDSRKIIKDGAKKYINSVRYIEQFAEEEDDDNEQQTGAPSTGYDNRSENVGGFSSLPGMLRQYMGFTSYPVRDRFGNEKLVNGQPVIATIDAVAAYYGLLRATANITDPVRFFQRMIRFADNNEQSRHFVEKFLKETGLDRDVLFNENRIEANNNKALVEIVKKGFNKFRIDYVFTEHDIKKGNYRSYHANRRNVENVQFDKWANTFIAGYTEMDEAGQKAIVRRIDDIRNTHFDERRITKRSPQETDKIVSDVRNALSSVGIQLSFDYIKYSLLSAAAKKYDNLAADELKKGNKITVEDAANKFISKEDYNYVQIMKIGDEITLNRDFMNELSQILNSSANPYFREVKKAKVEDEETQQIVEFEEEIDTAMVTRLLNVARGNAQFDETVGESSYTNAEGKIVYAHQDGTFNVKYAYQLRDAAYRKQLREKGYREELTAYRDAYDSEWLTNNFLLNSSDFEKVADNLLFQNIDGMRAVETNSLGRVITQEFKDQKEGVTYGDYSPREFMLNMLNLYISYHKNQKTSQGDVITTPHLIRVLEASKTANTVNLPMNTDLFREGKTTDKTLNILFDELKKEYNRIQRVQREIGNLKENLVENYHTGSFAEDGVTVTKGYRGLLFTDNMTSLISPSTAERFAKKARNGENITEEEKTAIKSEIANSMNKMVDDMLNLLDREGIVKYDGKHYTNILLHADFFRGNPELNLNSVDLNKPNSFKNNIGHVLLNDYINTLTYNQILHGDSALSLKNDGGIDAVKRAKGDNAAITSIRTDVLAPELGITEPFTHSSVAIFKEPVSSDGTKIADAQMYTTVKGLRYTLWGLGRLSPRLARFLDALEDGADIHALVDENGKTFDGVFDDSKGILRWDEMTNSLKLVFKDGKSYFKMSVVVLQPSLTSYKDSKTGEWKPRPNWKTLDNLRRKMEKDGIHFAAPESASKMMTLDVSKAKDFSDLKGHLFDNTYFGLQTENPSNKLEITTPTQLIQLIDGEQNDDVETYLNGEKKTIKEIKEIYQDAVSQKVYNAYEAVRNEIYDIKDFSKDIDTLVSEGKVVPRLAKFYQRVSSTLEASGSDAQLLDFFSLDDNGDIQFNMNLSAVKTKSEQLYLSYFSKGILSQKNPGYTVALMSGIDTKTIRRAKKIVDGKVAQWDYVRTEHWDTNHNNIQNEKILNSRDLVTEVGQYYMDELQHDVPEYDEDGNLTGNKYSECVLPPHFKELLELSRDEEIAEAIYKMFGVRIPSQDKHSFISLRMIDFMPANLGSTGMFAKELIALSGADFDIDKLFISRYDFYITRDARGKASYNKYGDAKTPEGKWEEYKMWMGKNNKAIKSIINDIAKDDTEYQSAIAGKNDKALVAELLGMDIRRKYFDKFVVQALKQLGLPSTFDEFAEASKSRELNNGVLNNRIVDSYISLLTNSGMKEIANTPATLTYLENISKDNDITLRDADGNVLSSVFEKKTNYPVDSIIGKYYGFKNNTTGKNNIGVDVNANLIYSIVNKGNIKLEDSNDLGKDIGITFDNQHFNSFGGDREYNIATGKFDGKRTNDILSTLITAATDEAKEQLNALYNLSVDALKVVNYLVALKVPLKTAIYFVNQPSVRNYLEIKAVKQNTIQTPFEENLFKDAFKEEALIRTRQQIKEYKSYTDDELFNMFEKNGRLQVEC